MRELISIWKPHILGFYELKVTSGFRYEEAEKVLCPFDRYYYNLNIDELVFSREIIENFIFGKDERLSNTKSRGSIIRQFGNYLLLNGILDNPYLLPHITTRGEPEYIPYIFKKEEYISFINHLKNIKPKSKNMKSNTINSVTLAFKILMSTGMRLGEVLGLKINDIDLENNLFIIKIAKNANQRIVPFSETIKEEIIDYIHNTPFNLPKEDYLFKIDDTIHLKKSRMTDYFYQCIKAIGIEHKKGIGPRIHDMRHTFAVMSLTELQRKENNINLSLSYLSSYLGHKDLSATQRYIWLTPELFSDVKERMHEYSSFIFNSFNEVKFDED